MVTPVDARLSFESKVNSVGVPFTLKSWASGVVTYSGADYDEEYLPTGSNAVGSATVVSGVGWVQPVGRSSDEVQYLAQGKIQQDDKALFFHGSIVSSPNMMVTFNGSVYDVLSDGVEHHSISGTVVYKKAFIRLNAGSYGVY